MSIARSSAAMAGGTTASRVLGVVRQSLIVLAIGQGLTANAFTTANTLPNVIYMLVAGGVLTSVLVPQLVKATTSADGGREYTDRLLTIAFVALLVVTVVATLAASLLVRLYAGQLTGSALDLATFFAVITIPQIFFYGMYGLLGQVLNARGQFAAFGWSPALANVVAIIGLAAFMLLFDGHVGPSEWTASMVWWFAGTATASIAAQALVLLYPLWRGGFRFRPRLGLRGVGLGATSKVAGWAFSALLVSQLSYLVASRVMWHATGDAPQAPGQPFVAGVAVWANALFVFMVPHSLVALSLFTAMYPRIAKAVHDHDLRSLRRDYAQGLSVPAAVTLPASAALIVFALPLTGLLYTSQNPAEIPATAATLAALAPGILPFGVDVLNQRYLYAFEDGPKAFTTQVVLTVTAIAVTLVSLAFPAQLTVPIIAIGLVVSNVASSAFGMILVRRRIGGFGLFLVVRSWVRIAIASALAGCVAWGAVLVLTRALPRQGRLSDAVVLAVGGALFGAVYYLLARVFHIAEVARYLDPVLARLRRRAP
ncbi:MAG: murein biosynthesis integral membrane protein MurJ [Dermatophilaceae bacterium]